jgi:hypothetical protein
MSLYERIVMALDEFAPSTATLEQFKAEIEAMEANSTAYLDQDASYCYQGKEEASA